MIRTQIQLTEEQAAHLKRAAHEGNESIASIIRKALDLYFSNQPLDRKALFQQAIGVVGKYSSDVSDVSLEHDRYLEEAYRS